MTCPARKRSPSEPVQCLSGNVENFYEFNHGYPGPMRQKIQDPVVRPPHALLRQYPVGFRHHDPEGEV